MMEFIYQNIFCQLKMKLGLNRLMSQDLFFELSLTQVPG